ncbi:cytochrome P450 4C1-like isoform X2 [Vespa crabro]|nr:cytochrome P450 4C1-like isoform X2 [Vespa crabro]XP_046826696.1 cytochrome P450 4C1-like isoform X2 [Vespa crabro]XP_046826697.1 cytochrome P450 4C1-like isoform X2 [Vespa crabro]XP_046826698.1 cytochrome P450 4C1-like isoform X2 [Vespa crabro]XP_046826699.1 cytochrome P450 4C1-like isoform X2 [Vespa crabro]
MFTILLGFISFLILLHYFIKFRRIGRLLELIPGPESIPIIGNVPRYRLDNDDAFDKTVKNDRKYYPIYKIWSFFFALVILLNPKDVEKLMRSTKHIGKGTGYRFLKPWLSDGLLITTGNKWQERRKILTPAFHFNILKHFVVTFNEEAKYLVSILNEETKDGPIIKDLMSFITEHSLNAICETAMGTSLKDKSELQSKYREAVHAFGKIVPYRLGRPWYHSDFIFSFSSLGRKQNELLKTLHKFSSTIIAERKRFHQETNGKYLQNFDKMHEDDVFTNGTNDINQNTLIKKRLAMLDLLIAASMNDNEIDDKGIQEEVDNFMFAGHDTTATTLCFALFHIAKYKSIQERIRNEIKAVMQENNCNLTMSMLNEFLFTERCIKESLRLYPTVPFISRYLTEDLQLDNYLVPAGVNCRVSIYHLHRNPEYWPNPNVFDPDRFLPENMKGRNPYSYIPFSAGLRNCIGQKFAMLEMKLMIAYILHNYHLEPVDELDDIKITGNIILRTSKPLRVKFIPIKQ